MSIGLGTKTALVRGMISYALPTHLYVNTSIAYQARSKVKADRDAYLAGSKLHQTNQVSVPDAFDAAFRFGYLKKDNQLEVFAEHFSCVGGDYIRRNDMPFITNDMTMTTVGVYGIVALVVRMDEFGYKLIALNDREDSFSDKIGWMLVKALPYFVRGIGFVGTLALLLVSGGIFAHNIPFFHHLLPTWPGMLKEFLFGLGVGIVVLLPVMGIQKMRKK
jgi:hypothetical protein